MPAEVFEYALLRVVPRVERGECVNVGVILFCKVRDFLETRLALDEARLRALDPALDLGAVREHLDAFVRMARGGPGAGALAGLAAPERFRWLTSPRSTIIQCSPVHAGKTDDPARALEHLLATMVRVDPGPPG